MTLTLYHSVESTCAQKVRLVLKEKGLQWEEIRLNLRRGDQFSPEYLRLNPKAVVPTLIHDDEVIRESTIINEYIDDSFPEPALKPAESGQRARMRLLVKAFDDEVHPSIGILSYAIFLRHQMNASKSPEELAAHFQKVSDPMRRERQMKTHEAGLASPAAAVAMENLSRVISLMADALRDYPWLAGDGYSLADAAAVPYLVRAQSLKLDRLWQGRSEIESWLQRAVERAEALELEDPWGSSGFATMVAQYAEQESTAILSLLNARHT